MWNKLISNGQLFCSVILLMIFFIPMILVAQTASKKLLIRSDDLGMCHAVNTANEQLIETGIPFSTSVIFAGPWYQETVILLKKHPNISVGVHLCLNAEWANYRWGPVAGKEAVPSLVDSLGYFRGEGMWAWKDIAKPAEIEREFRAQIERALATGLKVDYVDNHMGAGMYTPEHRAIVEKLAKEYGLGISSYFQENKLRLNIAQLPYDDQLDALIEGLENVKNGINLMVFHLGLTTPEMNALSDLNPEGTKQMSRQRETELKILSDPRFLQALKDHEIQLITYRELIHEKGLDNMQKPEK